MFELWNAQTRNAIGSYATIGAAYQAVEDLMDRGYPASALFLARTDSRGGSRPVASGPALVAAAAKARRTAARRTAKAVI